MGVTEITEENLSLEDAFIGLTGKYYVMNLFRALSYKEWIKTRRLIGVMLLLMAAAVGYTYIDLTHEIRLNEAVNVWYGCLFRAHRLLRG